MFNLYDIQNEILQRTRGELSSLRQELDEIRARLFDRAKVYEHQESPYAQLVAFKEVCQAELRKWQGRDDSEKRDEHIYVLRNFLDEFDKTQREYLDPSPEALRGWDEEALRKITLYRETHPKMSEKNRRDLEVLELGSKGKTNLEIFQTIRPGHVVKFPDSTIRKIKQRARKLLSPTPVKPAS